jgi:hypothetical protein
MLASPPLPEPTEALPGSMERVEVMRKRVELGQAPRHPQDATLENHLPPVWTQKECRRLAAKGVV